MKAIISAILLASMVSMCSHDQGLETQHSEVIYEEHVLALNGTARWEAVERTSLHIRQLQNLLLEFGAQAENKSVAAYNDLGMAVYWELQQMLMDCTMQGAAHDMLHVYLVPLINDIKYLEGKDEVGAALALDRIDVRLKEFNVYFINQ